MTCVHCVGGSAQGRTGTAQTGESGAPRCSFPQRQGIAAYRAAWPTSTKTPFKVHTRGCRVRRKRQRLTSNDSIESDAAIQGHAILKLTAPRHFR
jgi:hypothetical protein